MNTSIETVDSAAVDLPAVDVWAIDLDAGRPDDRALLSTDERTRADAFRFDRDRNRYTSAHAAVRRLLADRLDTPPERIEFGTIGHGKPVLVHHPDVHLNLSHSAGVALLALGDVELGVDVEYGPADLAVAHHFFGAGEVDELMRVPVAARDQAFLTCWARKEAYLKAKGGGLSFPLDRFAVSLRPDEPARLLWSDLDAPDEHWTIIDLTDQLPPTPTAGAAALVLRATEDAQSVTDETAHRVPIQHSVRIQPGTSQHATSQGV